MSVDHRYCLLQALALPVLFCLSCFSQTAPKGLSVDWTKVDRFNKTSISIQDCPEPPLFRNAPTHNAIYKALHDLQANYARLQPWFPYPRISVAELEPPHDGQTFWNFQVMDEVAVDFIAATKGRSVVFDISTIPQWMFRTSQPVKYSSNPSAVVWDYEQGTELRDPTLNEVAEYQARLASWYTKGGFTDEFGKWHESGHHFKIDYWEVLNEVDFEHKLSPEVYTRIYDAVVEKVRAVAPGMKFIGLALADPMGGPEYFTYFLDHRNHKAGIPIDMISYHFYSQKARDLPMKDLPYSLFEQTDKFLVAVRFIDAIRKHFSPETGVYIDELGSLLPEMQSVHLVEPLTDFYWNATAAMWAYAYGRLAQLGIDAVGGAELIDYPGQFAATTLLDWDTGAPNARYRVLKLLHDHFAPGDKLIATKLLDDKPVFAQAFIDTNGRRKILFVNQRAAPTQLAVPGTKGGIIDSIDLTTASGPPSRTILNSDEVGLQGLAVAVLTVN